MQVRLFPHIFSVTICMDETSEVTTEVKEETQEKPASPIDWTQSEWFKEWEELARKRLSG